MKKFYYLFNLCIYFICPSYGQTIYVSNPSDIRLIKYIDSNNEYNNKENFKRYAKYKLYNTETFGEFMSMLHILGLDNDGSSCKIINNKNNYIDTGDKLLPIYVVLIRTEFGNNGWLKKTILVDSVYKPKIKVIYTPFEENTKPVIVKHTINKQYKIDTNKLNDDRYKHVNCEYLTLKKNKITKDSELHYTIKIK